MGALFIGALDFLVRTLSWLGFFWRQVARYPKNLMAEYGNQKKTVWAVVTGGSDGIGLAMAHQMAARGFGVCIMARNLDKMNKCLEEIKKAHPAVETKAVVCDFSQVYTMADYRKIVERDMATMDIAVLGLNAGMGV